MAESTSASTCFGIERTSNFVGLKEDFVRGKVLEGFAPNPRGVVTIRFRRENRSVELKCFPKVEGIMMYFDDVTYLCNTIAEKAVFNKEGKCIGARAYTLVESQGTWSDDVVFFFMNPSNGLFVSTYKRVVQWFYPSETLRPDDPEIKIVNDTIDDEAIAMLRAYDFEFQFSQFGNLDELLAYSDDGVPDDIVGVVEGGVGDSDLSGFEDIDSDSDYAVSVLDNPAANRPRILEPSIENRDKMLPICEEWMKACGFERRSVALAQMSADPAKRKWSINFEDPKTRDQEVIPEAYYLDVKAKLNANVVGKLYRLQRLTLWLPEKGRFDDLKIRFVWQIYASAFNPESSE